ncbi:MAG: hypothetical protein CEN89_726 [Candidatus Berkelbacteria bacterium Licking1014_7]|uniref:Uncharacterized protein n=1 Tax=Candidatus Berkelbacteria bacterium Licking1014_7 TaxID=2017147 RepID=A0A554LHS0_9BACT|nr:MAG: hypothetical protein CEN89_726 [Candidatus Berkelbacteria bacterium Licking1014_7]
MSMNGQIFRNSEETRKAIFNNIQHISKNASSMVDNKFQNEIDIIVEKLSKTFHILNIIVNYTDQKKVSDIKFDSNILLWQGANALVGSLQLIRQGYLIEPNILNRYVVESLTLAIDLFTNPNHYQKFKDGKLSGEKCITSAKKVIRVIGQIYGILSQMTHPQSSILGTYFVRNRNTMLIGGGVLKETLHRVGLNLGILGFVTHVFLGGVELIFYDFVPCHRFWVKQGGNLYKWQPNDREKKFGEMTQKMIHEALLELKESKND